jgi:toxin ParE1/3/4
VKIIWTPRAIRELEAIHEYISKDSVARANDMVARVLNRSEQLSEFPNSGRRVPEVGVENVREVIEPPYRLIYRIKRDERR